MSGIGDFFGNTFGGGGGAQNQNVSLAAPVDYQTQLANIKRQQQLADALREQATTPITIQKGPMGQAPIPWTAVLAKALAGAEGGVADWAAAKQQKDLTAQDAAQVQALGQRLNPAPNYQVATPSQSSIDTTLKAATPQLPGGPAPAQQNVAMATPGAAGPAAQGPTNTTPAPDFKTQISEILSAPGTGPQMQAYKQFMLAQLGQQQGWAHQEEMQKAGWAHEAAVGQMHAMTAEEKQQYHISPDVPALMDGMGRVSVISDPNHLSAFQQA